MSGNDYLCKCTQTVLFRLSDPEFRTRTVATDLQSEKDAQIPGRNVVHLVQEVDARGFRLGALLLLRDVGTKCMQTVLFRFSDPDPFGCH